MSRLIDADALMDDIMHSLDEMTKIRIAVDMEWLWAKLNDALENAPTIQPERKTGHWIKLYTNNYKCSECGDWWGSDDNEMVEDFKFCPNCGADMREGEKDG